MLRKILLTLILIALPFSISRAGPIDYIVENAVGVFDTLSISSSAITARAIGIDLILDSMNVSTIAASAITNDIWTFIDPAPDTSLYYLAGQDTNVVFKRLRCDTMGIEYRHWGDTLIEIVNTECDSIWRLNIQPRWERKIRVRLTPDYYEKLMDLLTDKFTNTGGKE